MIETQLKVPIATMIITATSAAIGICATHAPAKTTISNKNTPAENADSRPRPPDFTLITDCRIIAQTAMHPTNHEAKLAINYPTDSRLVLIRDTGRRYSGNRRMHYE